MYINRNIENSIKTALKSFSVVAVTGPRQTGKSTLLKTLFGKQYNYITFDDPLVRERATDDPVFFLDNLGDKAIIDEIQYVPQILPYIKIRVDENRDQKGKYIITGSQQFNLMKNISETLAGRIALFTLLPFDIDELGKIDFLKNRVEKNEDRFIFAALKGLFPEPCTNENIDHKLWYSAYIQTYLERDIRTLYNLGNIRDFTRFTKLLASNCSQILNFSQYARDIGVSVGTIKSWLSILEAGNLIYSMEPYYKNFGKRIVKSPKIYWNDTGLVCYLTGIYNREHLLNGPMGGALFENYVVHETIKHFYNAGQRPFLYYLRTSNGLEVDILLEYENKVFPFEIKMSKSPKLSMAKQLIGFKELFPDLNIRESTIISLADSSYRLTESIYNKSVEDYLLFLKTFTETNRNTK